MIDKSRLHNLITAKFKPLAFIILSSFLLCNLMSVAAEAQDTYNQTNLVSDISGTAKITDPNVVNPWGIARSPTGPWWVNDNGKGVSTVYNGQGQPTPSDSPLVVTIPPPRGASGPSAPTGIVSNGTKDFEITPGNPAKFIFVTEDGTISAWNPAVDPKNAVLKVDNSSASAVYKGATIALNEGVLYLYVANFKAGTIEVYDTNFKKVSLPQSAFTDEKIPSGFAPFNVVNVSGVLFVTYAKQDAQKQDDVPGAGNGFVDIFGPDGSVLTRFKTGEWLNSPWGVAIAPGTFGKFSNMLLVGNFGSGQIAVFDPRTGEFIDRLKGSDGKLLSINGLWGLGFGNGTTAGPTTTLFFAAGINDEKDGLFGTITPTGQ